MALSLTHTFVSTVADGADATLVRPGNWNATHTISGALPVANGGTAATTAFSSGAVVFACGAGTYTENPSKLHFDDTNIRLGIGSSVPSHVLDLAGGSTLQSPVHMSSGTLVSPPVKGTIEYDGNVFYGTCVSSAAQIMLMDNYIVSTGKLSL